MLARDHHGERDFAPSVVAAKPHRVGTRRRIPASVWLYVGLAGGTIVLYEAGTGALAGLWWLAPAAVFGYVLAMTLTVVLMTTRKRRDRAYERRIALLAQRLRTAITAGEAARRAALQPLLSRVRDVRSACEQTLTTGEAAAVRASLIELGAHDAVTRQIRRSAGTRRRADALFTLGWLGDERSVPVLATALTGLNVDLAYVAAQALAEYDSAPACHALVGALQKGSLPRPLVATLLESSRYAGATELVAAASGDGDARVRNWVAFLLGRSSDPRSRAWLAPLAADENADVRASAAEAYGTCPDQRMLETLLVDDDWRVRANAAKAIGNAGLSQLVPQVATLMSDRTWWVRQSATIALKQLGHASVEQLCRLLEDDDRFVRNKAAEVLIEVGFISQQIAALGGTPDEVAAARYVLAAVVRAEARATLESSLESAEPVTRDRLVALLDEVDSAGTALEAAA